MPITLDVTDLRPGMVLYQAVCNEYVVLLPAGKALDERDVDALRRKFPEMKIRIADPLLDEIFDFQDDTRDREIGRTVQETMSRALSNVRRKLAGRTEMRSQDVLSLQRATTQILEYLRNNPVTAILLEKTQRSDTYLQQHSSNVFYTSMVVGNSIKQYIVEERERLSRTNRLERSYALNLTPLAMGCLLHDIGMLNLQDIYNSVSDLTPEQRVRLENHPLVGEKMLPNSLSSVARMVVRTHHENYNGTGYPLGMDKEKLHVFSRIIRIADAFDAATSPRIYKKAKSEVRVLWEMVNGAYRDHYDQVIAKVFVHMVHPFPIGAKLKLTNGQIGVVVQQNPTSPFFPKIILAYDKDGNRIPREKLTPPIMLSEDHDLKIVAYNGEDLTYLYTLAAAKSEEPTRRESPQEVFGYAYP